MTHLALRPLTAAILRLTLVVACAAAFVVAVKHSASAEELGRPTLRPAVTVRGDVVTIGDFFTNPGRLADTPLFRPPDLGEVGTVDAWSVLDAAHAAGLANGTTGGVREVVVTRASIAVTPDQITALISRAIGDRLAIKAPNTVSVTYTRLPELVDADAGAVDPVRLSSLDWSRTSGRFNGVVIIDRGSHERRFSVSGTALEMVDVVVPQRSLAKDAVISRGDLEIIRLARGQVDERNAMTLEEVIGMAPRRSLRPGQPIGKSDLAQPLLVRRGEAVTVVYQVPGLTLTARGQALESGAEGDMVNVLNSQSRRIVRGSVIARGKVQIITGQQSVIKLSEASR
ncbi:MAG: flagella basal body P-ring formation protein FlgA [Hyphomicrobiales bacterium]|nr:MAG: flagella basal body P-ring formation protein FlgA [Hyphomicrobiales bacterium]